MSIDSNYEIKPFSTGQKLTKEMINKAQQPYVTPKTNKSLGQDSLELSQTKPKEKWYQKGKKYLIAAGVGLVTIGAVVLGKRKLDANKIKKAEAEARRIAEEARQKAREAEEKLRIEAEEKAQAQRKAEAEARQKAKLEAEAKAKAEAEEKARIEAERAKEAERLALIAEYNKKIEDITTKFEDDCVIKYCGENGYKIGLQRVRELQQPISGTTMDEYAQCFVDSVKKAENEGIKPEDIAKIYEKMHDSANLSDSQIEVLTQSYGEVYEFSYKVKHQLKARKQFIQDLDKLKQENPQQENEKLSDYLQRLINKRKENVELEKQKRIETIKSRLQYSDSAVAEEKIELNADEIEELREALLIRKCTEKEKEEIKNADLSKLISEYLDEATSDYDAPGVSDRIQKACFGRIKRYNSTTSQRESEYSRDNTYKYEPLYRWMGFGNKCDEFAEETFKIGGEYTFPKKQSCSKDKYFAETMFRDDNGSMNFKFIIHPKSETSRAVDTGMGHYGCNEAVYNKGERFRVIDVYDEEVTNPRAKLDSSSWANERSFYRKIVHLQEM